MSSSLMTETDKMIRKLDDIILYLGGKEGKFDLKSSSGFERAKFKVGEKLKEAEELSASRDLILNSTIPKEIYERKSLESKIETLLEESERGIKEMEAELKSQKKKKGKYGDFSEKEKLISLLEQKMQIIRSKMDGLEVDSKLVEENKSSIEEIEEKEKSRDGGESDRELNELEKAKIDEWKEEMKEQDKDLEEIGGLVKQLGHEVKLAGQNIENVHNKAKAVSKATDKTTQKVESQNKKLKDLLGKIRSGDKICVDIVLILILLGLIAVLYNLIK